MAKVSARRAAVQARKENTKALLDGHTADSFQNALANMGLGTDNISSGATYGFNPITRNRIMLEWIHRGSWVGGIAIDVIADDMTRAGVTVHGLKHPADIDKIGVRATQQETWGKINEVIKWSRLYGGAIGVMMIDGQDMKTPLRPDRISKGQFKGILPLDRWQIESEMMDLVDEMGPRMGEPRFYRISENAPGLRGKVVHYSRVIRLDGIKLPWNQRMQENLWGISVLERLYDRMVAFDSATTGAAQLVYKSYIRTLKIDGYKKMVGENGPATAGMSRYVNMMRMFQSVEGLNVIDAKDSYDAMPAPGFSGLADALMQFGQQISGALQIPLVRMFGQSPAGLNSTGESDLITYYDGIKHRQEEQLLTDVTTIYQMIARSEGIADAEQISVSFNPLWQLKEDEKAKVANQDSITFKELYNDGILPRGTVLRELLASSKTTGRFSFIDDQMIKDADDEPPPLPEGVEVAQARHGMTPPGEEPPKPTPGAKVDPTSGVAKS